MKAIKFVILAAGLLGLISFFLPLLNVDKDDVHVKISSFDVVKGLQLAEEFKSKVEKDVATLDETGEGKAFMNEIDDALAAVKIFVLILFAPSLLLVAIGGVGAARGKLERLGGVGALFVGLIGMAISGLVLAAWGSAEVKESGGSSGIAVYLMFIASIAGFLGGLLTLIKPDRGGRFA
jgi:hypothetical protein